MIFNNKNNIMAAPKGNKYHEKYDYETAKTFFEDSLEKVKTDTSIMYIGTLAVKMNTYRQLYDYLLDRFNDLDTIKKQIDGILESRVVEAALKNSGNPTYKIFHLKNNHGWKDRQDHNIEHRLEDVTQMTTEELRERARLIREISDNEGES